MWYVHTHIPPPPRTHTQSPSLVLDLVHIWWVIWPLLQAKLSLPQGLPHPHSQSGTGRSGFWLLFWILHPGNPILCPQFGLEEKRSKNWSDICKEEENLFLPPMYSGVVISLYPSNSLGGEAMLCENQSKSDCSSVSIEKAFERWKNCQLYLFELDSIQALPEGIPFTWCLSGAKKGGRKPGTRHRVPKCMKRFLLTKNDTCFPS